MTLTQVSTWFANARRRLKKENRMTWDRSGDDSGDVNVDDDGEKWIYLPNLLINPTQGQPGPSRLSSPGSENMLQQQRTPVNNNDETSPSKSAELITSANSRTATPRHHTTLAELPTTLPNTQLLMSLQQQTRLAPYLAQIRATQEQTLRALLNQDGGRVVQAQTAGQIWKLADMANQTTNESD